MCVLTLQIVIYLLLHFLGFIFSATNKLWKGKKKTKQLELYVQLTTYNCCWISWGKNLLMLI